MTNGFKSIRWIIGLFLVVLLAEGCAQNLPAIREFSQATVVASSSFDTIADDIPKSCIRRVDAEEGFKGARIVVVDDSVEFSKEYKDKLSTCDALKESLNGIMAANGVLKGYAQAIGQLASDGAVTFTSEMGTLEASLRRINIGGDRPFEGPKAKAVSELARFLSNAAVRGYRQKELKETIETANPYLENLIDGLIAVSGDYQAVLRGEEQQVRNVQVNLVIESEKPENKGRIQEREMDERLFATRREMEIIESKRRAVEDYKTVLKKISETHGELYKNKDQLNSQALIPLVEDYAKQLIPLINSIKEAFAR